MLATFISSRRFAVISVWAFVNWIGIWSVDVDITGVVTDETNGLWLWHASGDELIMDVRSLFDNPTIWELAASGKDLLWLKPIEFEGSFGNLCLCSVLRIILLGAVELSIDSFWSVC